MLAKKYRSVSYISLPLIRLQVKQRDKKSLQRYRTVVSSPPTIMSPSPMRDFPVPHVDGPHHRREAAPKPKEMKPLLTREPLPHDRKRKPVVQTKKTRKPVVPTTPALSFPPNRIPSGRQDSPASPLSFSRPSASESSTSTSSYDEHQTPFTDREIHDHSYDGYDAQKRPRIFSGCPSTEHSTSPYLATPCTDLNDMSSVLPDFYDSPTSSSSPAPSDQSHCAADFAVQVIDYASQAQPPLPMHPYGNQVYIQQPVVRQDSYGYPVDACPDRAPQGYPVQYIDTVYGRGVPHGIPAYSDNNGYPYPPPHRF